MSHEPTILLMTSAYDDRSSDASQPDRRSTCASNGSMAASAQPPPRKSCRSCCRHHSCQQPEMHREALDKCSSRLLGDWLH